MRLAKRPHLVPGDTLPLLIEEYFDVEEQLKSLEHRKEKLRTAILEELKAAELGGINVPRGTVTRQAYSTFKGLRPTQVLPMVQARGWIDEVLTVNGRGLHKLARPEEPLMVQLRGMCEETTHEGIVVRLAR
jgi:hypothetical protein